MYTDFHLCRHPVRQNHASVSVRQFELNANISMALKENPGHHQRELDSSSGLLQITGLLSYHELVAVHIHISNRALSGLLLHDKLES